MVSPHDCNSFFIRKQNLPHLENDIFKKVVLVNYINRFYIPIQKYKDKQGEDEEEEDKEDDIIKVSEVDESSASPDASLSSKTP